MEQGLIKKSGRYDNELLEDYREIAPVHQELLTKNGVYILEHMDTRALWKDKVDEFLFVLGIPKLRGTVQGIVNPIAIR